MIFLNEIIESCKAEAIAGRLAPNEVNEWRYYCREYSKTFHTPLHVVLTMPPEQVILPFFEEQLGKKNLSEPDQFEAIVEEIRRLQDPNYDENKEKSEDDYVKGIEAWEAERVRKGAPIPRPNKKKKKVEAEEPEPVPETRKQGFVDLSRFAHETEES
jgi:hypothetical protein